MNATTTHSSSARADVATSVEASCRMPLLVLYVSALIWLLLAVTFGFIASLKFHAPQFLAGCPNLTYGRLVAAQSDCALYGFALQAGLAFVLWLFVRMGRTAVASPIAMTIAASFWNFGLTIGVLGVFGGDATGFESFQVPSYGAWIMWASYVVMGIVTVFTYANREEQNTYPAQWFGLTALFWFSWIFATAALLLLQWPVRGVVQSSINWWYSHNLHFIVLGFFGLASIFYFVPKLLGRPLFSRQLALFSFWLLCLFGSWGGIPNGSPLPAWISGMSVVGLVLTSIPVIAVVLNLFQTVRQDAKQLDSSWPLKFTYVGLMFWVIATVQLIVGALPAVSSLTDFTWFTVAQKTLWVYGFFALTMFGAMYYILPRLAGIEWHCGKLTAAHFWLTFLGVLLSYICLLCGGIAEGYFLTDQSNSFLAVMKSTLPALRVSTLGDVLLVLGQIAGLLNLMVMVVRATGHHLKTIKS
jgi:cytochrome c oxidase cbb3-type subunit 1